jgi:hypothetical protein
VITGQLRRQLHNPHRHNGFGSWRQRGIHVRGNRRFKRRTVAPILRFANRLYRNTLQRIELQADFLSPQYHAGDPTSRSI